MTKTGLLEDLLGEIALVLGLKVAAPVDGILELVVVLLQNLHGLGVGNAAKFRGHHMVQPVQQALVHELELKKFISSGACSST